MTKKEAERILKCWINCPCAFNNGQCEKDVDDYCELGCWSPTQVREAIDLLITEIKI